MKRSVALIVCVLAALALTSTAGAALQLVPAGNDLQADISAFPPDMKEAYAVYKVKCVKCHKLERSLNSIKSGTTPSMINFDDNAITAYGAKMLRKSESKMSPEEVKTVTKLLRFMRKEAGH